MRYSRTAAIFLLVVGFVLFVLGIVAIPPRPPTVMTGNTTTSGISDDDYTSLVVRSPAFIEFMVGIALGCIGVLILLFRMEDVPEATVTPDRKEVRFQESTGKC